MDAAQLRSHGVAELPDTLESAVAALEADEVITAALGPHVAGQYITGKRREWSDYRAQVTPWELERYLITY